MGRREAIARRDEKHLSFGIRCDLYNVLYVFQWQVELLAGWVRIYEMLT